MSWRVWATMTLIRWSFSRSKLHTLCHHTPCNKPLKPSASAHGWVMQPEESEHVGAWFWLSTTASAKQGLL